MLGSEKMQKQATHNEALFIPLDQVKPFAAFCLVEAGLTVEQLPTDSVDACTVAAQKITESDARSHKKFDLKNPGDTSPLEVGRGRDEFGRKIYALVSRSLPGLTTAGDVANYGKRPPFSVPINILKVPKKVNHKALAGQFMADTTIKIPFKDQASSFSWLA